LDKSGTTAQVAVLFVTQKSPVSSGDDCGVTYPGKTVYIEVN